MEPKPLRQTRDGPLHPKICRISDVADEFVEASHHFTVDVFIAREVDPAGGGKVPLRQQSVGARRSGASSGNASCGDDIDVPTKCQETPESAIRVQRCLLEVLAKHVAICTVLGEQDDVTPVG